MKKIISILFFALVCRFAAAQEIFNVADGFHKIYYPNGVVSSEGIIRDGRIDGFWKSYYVTGVIKSEGKRTNFLLDSVWVFYDQVGDTIEKINYLVGKKNGYYYKYKKDPMRGVYIYSSELFVGDRKEGTSYLYFPDGKVQQTILYSEGRRNGLSKEYDQEGNILTLLEYRNDILLNREQVNRTDVRGLKQGEWKEFYPNGNIKSEKTYKDDLLHGYYKEYDERGRLSLTMLYENGSIVRSNVENTPNVEITNRYDPNGRLVYSGPYKDRVPVGVHREFEDGKVVNSFIYDDNGLLLSEGIVDEAGNRNGKWKDLYPDGKTQAEGQYTDNRKSGVWRYYTKNGSVEQTGSYNAERPDGVWKWYYESGQLLREEEYFRGQRDGMRVEYSETGDLLTEGLYTDGEKNGDWKYRSGDYTEEGKYIIGLKDGVWRAYYPNGKLLFRGNFIQDNPDGEHRYY
jgi:antitoxin component YwqK of YwqJK toxin-antitoxin module